MSCLEPSLQTPLDPGTACSVQPGSLLDRVLRDGDGLTRQLLSGPHSQAMIAPLLALAVGGAAVFGVAVGVQGGPLQAVLSGLKFPLVILGSTALSLPLLHVACAQAGQPVAPHRLSALVLQAVATATVAMAGLAPLAVVTWLTVRLGDDGTLAWYAYRRLVLAAVGVGGLGGLLGAARLWRALPRPAVLTWALMLGLTGLQLTWLLRPIIGQPGGIAILRAVEGSGLAEVLVALAAVFGA